MHHTAFAATPVEEVGNVQASPASDSASRAGLAKLNAMSVSDACDAFTAYVAVGAWHRSCAAVAQPMTSPGAGVALHPCGRRSLQPSGRSLQWSTCWRQRTPHGGSAAQRNGERGLKATTDSAKRYRTSLPLPPTPTPLTAGSQAAEQRTAMSAADAATLASLESAVAAYEAKFGFACIIYAPGKSADVLLAIAQRRLGNAVDTELRVAAEQVSMITRYRLENLAYAPGSPPSRGDGRSPVTTHILDTALGRPGAGVSLQLQIQGTDGTWRPLGSGVTSACGRALCLLAARRGSPWWLCVGARF